MKNSVDGPVLVTGGAGYIGGQTVLSLLDAGVQVCVIDDLSTGQMRPFHADVRFYEGRIHDEALLDAIFSEQPVKAVMHFAGSIKVDESVSNPLKYYENNTEGSRRLIDASVRAGVKDFIFSSTAAVYGATDDKPVKETASTEPLNPYGWSKLFTEQQLKDVSGVSDMRYGIFRYFNVAGADGDLRHGQFTKNPSHLIGRSINALLENSPPLTIFGNTLPTPDGTGVRDYIHVQDVASAHVALLGTMQKRATSYLLNLGYGRGSSVLDIVGELEKEVGQSVPYEFGPPREGEAPSVVADVSGLATSLEWQPEFNDLRKMLRSAYNWTTEGQE